MAVLNIRGYLPGIGVKTIIVVDTENVSFIVPCPGCNLVQIHCSGTYFDTDRAGTNSIVNAMEGNGGGNRDIKMSEGYENVIDWVE